MLPTEQFSGDATEDKTPWTPQVWRDGPDVLVAQAQQALFQHRADVEGALGSGDPAAIAGPVNQGANESEQLIDPSQDSGRASVWKTTLNNMRSVYPLAGTVKPLDYDPDPGDANPNV